MTLFTLSVVQQIPQETKHRDIISRSTSNNSSQAQEFNLPDVPTDSQSRNDHSSKQAELFIVQLGVQNSQICQWFWNILEDLDSY